MRRRRKRRTRRRRRRNRRRRRRRSLRQNESPNRKTNGKSADEGQGCCCSAIFLDVTKAKLIKIIKSTACTKTKIYQKIIYTYICTLGISPYTEAAPKHSRGRPRKEHNRPPFNSHPHNISANPCFIKSCPLKEKLEDAFWHLRPEQPGDESDGWVPVILIMVGLMA